MPSCEPASSSAGPDAESSARLRPALRGVATALSIAVLLLGLTLIAGFDSDAQHSLLDFTSHLTVGGPSEEATAASAFIPRELETHPDVRYGSYLTPSASDGNPSSLESQFRDLLDRFEKRQGKDDNFTIRVFDNRTGQTLEVYEMEEKRAVFERGEPIDWREVDDERREITTRLVDEYEDHGYPRESISVRWGRSHQVHEAHEAGLPIMEYEKKLAHHLDLSLLPTKISMVETFNQDELVSSAGARSRYQLMPDHLRRNGINSYSLSTSSGASVEVDEHLHPLLVLEPAFSLLRGYVNAVGHEIPGISAYHTGPGNIYTLYRTFMTEAEEHFRPTSTVMDAYVWGVTEGFDKVSSRSTFGPRSRGYVASAYGSLRATDTLAVDRNQTLRAARVQLHAGTTISLNRLLGYLADSDESLDWGPDTDGLSPYERFKQLNPHMHLPPTDDGAVPEDGNIELSALAPSGNTVRFFLPLGAPAVLDQLGVNVLNEAATFRFDENTFTEDEAQRTRWDDAYDELVRNIERFGFTMRNRNRLMLLHDEFKRLAAENPSPFRKRQLRIIEAHWRVWRSGPWDRLADVTQEAFDQPRVADHSPTLRDLEITAPDDDLPLQLDD